MGCSVDVSFELLPPKSSLLTNEGFKESPFLQVDWNDSSTLITGHLKNEDYTKLEQFYQELASNHQAGGFASAGDVVARVLHRLYPLSGNLADTLLWLLEKGPCGHLPLQKSLTNSNHPRFLICIHWRPIPGCSKDTTNYIQEFVSFSSLRYHPYISCCLNLNPHNLYKLGLEPKLSRSSSFTPCVQLRRFGCRKTMSPENDSFTKDPKGSMFRYVKNVFNKKHFRKKKTKQNELIQQDINPVYILKLSESEDEDNEKTYSSESEESLPSEENPFNHSKSIIYQSRIESPNLISLKGKNLETQQCEKAMSEKYEDEEEIATNDLKYSENNLLEEETLLFNRNLNNSHKDFFDNILHSINIPNHSENTSKEEENFLSDGYFEDQPANYSQNIGHFMNSVDELSSNFLSDNRIIINTNPETRTFPENGNFVVKSSFIEDILSSNPLLRKKPYYIPHSKLKNNDNKKITKEQPKIEKSDPKLVDDILPTMADFNSIVSPLLMFKSPLNLDNVSAKDHSINKCKKENVFKINVSPKIKKHKPANEGSQNGPALDACNSSLVSPLTLFNSPHFKKPEIESKTSLDIPKPIMESSESDQRTDSNSGCTNTSSKPFSYPIGDIGKEQIGANCLIDMVHRAAERNLLDKRTAFDLAVDAMTGSCRIGLNEKITPKPRLSPERFHPPPPKFPAPSCLPINPLLSSLPESNCCANEEDNLINVFEQLAILNHKCKALLNDFDEVKVENTPTTISSEETIRIVTHLSPQNCFDDSSNATMHTEEVTKNDSLIDTNKELWTRYLNENIFANEIIHQDRINPFKKINAAETTNSIKSTHIPHYRRKMYSLNNEPNWMHYLASSRSAFQFSTEGADPTDLLSCMPLSETRINCNLELKLFRKRMNHLLSPPPTHADSTLTVPHDIIPLEAKPSHFSMNVLSLDGDQLLKELIDKENVFLDINQPIRKAGGMYFFNLIDDERFCFLESKFVSAPEYRMCTNIERSQSIQMKSKLHNDLVKQNDYNTICSLLLAKFIDMNAKSKFIKYKNNRFVLKKQKANIINIFQRRIRSGLSYSINSDPSRETIINVNEKMIKEKNEKEKVELFKIEEDKTKISFDVKTELQQFVMEFGNFMNRKSNNSAVNVKENQPANFANSSLSDASSFDSNFLIKEKFLEPVLGPIQFILDHKDDIIKIDSQDDTKETETQMKDKAVETFQEMNTNITTMAVQCRMTENITDSGQTTGSSLTNNTLVPVLSQDICLKEFYNNVLTSLEKMEHSINQVFCIEKFCTIISPNQKLPLSKLEPLIKDQPTSPITLGSKKIISKSENGERQNYKNIFLEEKSIQKMSQNFAFDKNKMKVQEKKKKKKKKLGKESLESSKVERTSFLNNRVTSPCINIKKEDTPRKKERNILLEKIKFHTDDDSTSYSKYNIRTAYLQKEDTREDLSPSVNVVFTNTEGELKSSSSSSACHFMQRSVIQDIQKPSRRDIGTIRTKINLTATALPNLSLSDRIYNTNSLKLEQIKNIHPSLQSKEMKVPNSSTVFSKKLNIDFDTYKNYYKPEKLNSKQIENKSFRKKIPKINKKVQISPMLSQEKIDLPLTTSAIQIRPEIKHNFIYNWRPALYIPSSSRLEDKPIVIKIKKPSRNKDLEVVTFDKFLKSENKSLEFGNHPNIQCKVINKNSLEQTDQRSRTKPMGVHSVPLKNPNLLREIILGKCPRSGTDRGGHPLQVQGDPTITTLDKIRFITAIQPSDNPHPSLLFTNDFCYLKPYLGFDNSSKNSTASNNKRESVFCNLENSFPKTKKEMDEHIREIKETLGEYKTRKRHDEETRKENNSKRHSESKSPARFQNGNTKPKVLETKPHRKNSSSKDYVTTCTAMGAGQWNSEYPSKKTFSLPSAKDSGSHLLGPFVLLNKLSEGLDHVVKKTISYLNRKDPKNRRK